jgi:uncharacterized protein (TIGR02596 family)
LTPRQKACKLCSSPCPPPDDFHKFRLVTHEPFHPMNSASRRRAFSLIELLVVISIIALVIGFAVPAANSMLRGSQLTQGSQQFSDQIAFARQSALQRNRPVEIRFYRYADLEVPLEKVDRPETWRFHAYQLFEILENGAALPIGRMLRFPRSVIADEDKYSTLLRKTLVGEYHQAVADLTVPELPIKFDNQVVGRNYEYTGFRFLQDGSTDLSPTTKPRAGAEDLDTDQTNDSWYITLLGTNDGGKPIDQVNFYTVQIDPVTGGSKAYRPGGK